MTPVSVTHSFWTKSVGYIPKKICDRYPWRDDRTFHSLTRVGGPVMGRLLGRGIAEGGIISINDQ